MDNLLPKYDENLLIEELSFLSKSQCLAFGVLCCERVIPNYRSFTSDSGWGDLVPLTDAIEIIWSSVSGQAIDREISDEIISRCESAAPNSDEFSSIFVTAAQDACFAVCALLDYLKTENVERVAKAATYATDSIDLFVQEKEKISPLDPDLEEKIRRHDLMQKELFMQRQSLDKIKAVEIFNDVAISQIKSSFSGDGGGNLQ
jgi:uncharacterized protein